MLAFIFTKILFSGLKTFWGYTATPKRLRSQWCNRKDRYNPLCKELVMARQQIDNSPLSTLAKGVHK